MTQVRAHWRHSPSRSERRDGSLKSPSKAAFEPLCDGIVAVGHRRPLVRRHDGREDLRCRPGHVVAREIHRIHRRPAFPSRVRTLVPTLANSSVTPSPALPFEGEGKLLKSPNVEFP